MEGVKKDDYGASSASGDRVKSTGLDDLLDHLASGDEDFDNFVIEEDVQL
jgi:hypothetical protein